MSAKEGLVERINTAWPSRQTLKINLLPDHTQLPLAAGTDQHRCAKSGPARACMEAAWTCPAMLAYSPSHNIQARACAQRLSRWQAWRTCVGSAPRSGDDGGRPVAHDAVLRAHARAEVFPVIHVTGYNDLRALLMLRLQLQLRVIGQRRHCVAPAILGLSDDHLPVPDLQAETLVGARICCAPPRSHVILSEQCMR